MSERTEAAAAMYAALGEMIANWNGLEWTLLELIEALSMDTLATKILTAHMSSPAWCQTLQALANERLPQHLNDHVRHAVLVFERLRDYRNQFVHRVTAVVAFSDEAIAYTYALKAGRQLKVDMGELRAADLRTMLLHCQELSAYLTWIKLHAKWAIDPEDYPPRAFRGDAEKIALPPELPSRWQDWTGLA